MQLFPLPWAQLHWFHTKPKNWFDLINLRHQDTFIKTLQKFDTCLLVKIESVFAQQIKLNPSLTAPHSISQSWIWKQSHLPVFLASLCSPRLRVPSAACVSGQMAAGRGICRRRRLLPPHRAETGVICCTVNNFMNTVYLQTASSTQCAESSSCAEVLHNFNIINTLEWGDDLHKGWFCSIHSRILLSKTRTTLVTVGCYL